MATRNDLPLLKGSLDMLVLKALSWKPLHGYAIASWLDQRSDGSLVVDDSALYQALHRLEGRRLIRGEWGVTPTNRRARFYSITREGRQQLKSEATVWQRYTEAVGSIMALTTPD